MNEPHGINKHDTTIQIFTTFPIFQDGIKWVCKPSKVMVTKLQYLQIV
jgi:hypothetical protein